MVASATQNTKVVFFFEKQRTKVCSALGNARRSLAADLG